MIENFSDAPHIQPMNQLTRLLKDCGLSHAEAADLLGVHRVTISQQARGAAAADGLRFLTAAWEQLSDKQKAAVKSRVEELRASS